MVLEGGTYHRRGPTSVKWTSQRVLENLPVVLECSLGRLPHRQTLGQSGNTAGLAPSWNYAVQNVQLLVLCCVLISVVPRVPPLESEENVCVLIGPPENKP